MKGHRNLLVSSQLKALIGNQKRISRAKAQSQGMVQAPEAVGNIAGDITGGIKQIKPVDIYHDARSPDDMLLTDFRNIMIQYLSDMEVVDDLFTDIGSDAAREFVINYNTYLPRLKKLEGQKFDQRKFFAIFKDMLVE